MKGRTGCVLILAAALSAAVIGSTTLAPAAGKRITVGSKNFTEQYIMGQMLKQLLEDRGFDVDLKSDLTSMALRAGLESGDIQVCAEYTGTAWMTHLKRKYEADMDHMEIYRKVRAADEKNDVAWLHPIWNHNSFALASWPAFAREHELSTLSDLAAFYRSRDGEVSTFVDFEFSTRPDGLPALEAYYDFHIAKSHLKTGAPGASVMGLQQRQAEVGMVFGTNAAIVANDWVVYEDDKGFFPPYDLAPCVRKEVLDDYPKVREILLELVASFPGGEGSASSEVVAETRSVWQNLNAEVDIQRKRPVEVARGFLKKHGLIP